MTDEKRPQDEQEPKDSQPAEPRPPEEGNEDEDEGVDPRILVVVGIVVLLIVIIYWRRAVSPPGEGEAPSERTPQTAEESDEQPPPTHEDLVLQRLAETSQFVYRDDDRLLIVARPPVPARPEENGEEILPPQPGTFFDVTRRVEGLDPTRLYRRQIGTQLAFADVLPPLGLGDDLPKPTFEKAPDVDPGVLSEEAAVYGAVADGTAKAYPAAYFNVHDVVNDTLGDTPVVLVYSAVARAVNAFERIERDGEPIAFGCSGLLRHGANVIYDAPTRSLWNGITGEALSGTMLGETLPRVTVITTSYGTWKELHPETLVMTGTDPDTQFDYSQDYAAGVEGYHNSSMILYPLDGFEDDLGVHPKAAVFGVLADGGAVAYEPQHLAEKGTIEDTIGGVNVSVSFDMEKGHPEARTEDGRALHTQIAYWFAWKSNYPESQFVPEQEQGADAPPPAPPADPSDPEGEPAMPPPLED